jgi:O-antigen ligase
VTNRPRPAWRDGACFALATATVTATGVASGAYFPEAWGWSGVLLLGVLGVVLLLAGQVEVSRAELAFLGALAAFVAWVGLSAFWSDSPTRSMLELERDIVYVAAVAALLALARRSSANAVAGGVMAATCVLAVWALAARLVDPGDGDRLARPLGYWNALGLAMAMGALLALGFASDARPGPRRAFAAALPVLLVTALALTYSRGAWIAFAVGLGVALAVGVLPGRTAATAALLAVPCAASASIATLDGRGAVACVVPLALAAAGAPRLADALVRRIRPGERSRRLAVRAGLVVAVGAIAVGIARSGDLGETAVRAYRSFGGPAPEAHGGKRTLLSVSGTGRAEYWRVAWDDARRNPGLGSGAGTFELAWDRDRHTIYDALDAHSLYLETLAELGPIGLALLVAALAAPLLALTRGRTHPPAAGVVGAYAAYLAHAGIDWDWELPAVTIAALACGCALLVAARRPERAFRVEGALRVAAVAVAAALGVFVSVAYAGDVALARSVGAYDAGRYQTAEAEARSAARWLRWSSEPWEQIGDAQVATGRRRAAHASYVRALDRDRQDWRLWYDVGITADGAARTAALARAARLNPLARGVLALQGR